MFCFFVHLCLLVKEENTFVKCIGLKHQHDTYRVACMKCYIYHPLLAVLIALLVHTLETKKQDTHLTRPFMF